MVFPFVYLYKILNKI